MSFCKQNVLTLPKRWIKENLLLGPLGTICTGLSLWSKWNCQPTRLCCKCHAISFF